MLKDKAAPKRVGRASHVKINRSISKVLSRCSACELKDDGEVAGDCAAPLQLLARLGFINVFVLACTTARVAVFAHMSTAQGANAAVPLSGCWVGGVAKACPRQEASPQRSCLNPKRQRGQEGRFQMLSWQELPRCTILLAAHQAATFL